MVRGDVRIEDAKGPDDLGFRIGEGGNCNVLPLGEVRQNLDRIIGDDGNAQALAAEPVRVLLQLDELRLAVGSPIRGAVEDNRGTLWPADRVEVPHLAKLVNGPEAGGFLSNSDPG